MADPPSIVTAAAAVAKAILKASDFIRDLKRDSIDSELDSLLEELQLLSSSIESIGQSFKSDVFHHARRNFEEHTSTTTFSDLNRQLSHCGRTVEQLQSVLSEVSGDGRPILIRRGPRHRRLDERQDEIDRIRSQMASHTDCLNLSLTVVQVLQVMHSDERDQHSSKQLQLEVTNLGDLIKKSTISRYNIAKKILAAKIVSAEDQTMLSDIVAIQESSMKIQHQAIEELQSRSSGADPERGLPPSNVSARGVPPRSVPDTQIEERIPRSSSRTAQQEATAQESTLDLTKQQSNTESEVETDGQYPQRFTSFPGPSPGRSAFFSRDLTGTTDRSLEVASISGEEFESSMTKTLAEAVARKRRPDKPFSDENFDAIGRLLRLAGKQTWSERPRTYLVLRLIGEVQVMDDFVMNGCKDIHFPYTEDRLPPCLKGIGQRQHFLQYQALVLSRKTADLVQGGPHRHFDGSVDSGFIVIRPLGQGGHGVVDQIRSKLSLQDYARKRIRRSKRFAKDKEALKMFENEIQLLKRLDHRHLVRFVGSYTDRNYVGIIMDPVADTDLLCYLTRSSIPDNDLANLKCFMGCLCAAVQYLHNQNCRHKDIKPANILIVRDKVLISDFGIALDWKNQDHDTTSGQPGPYTDSYAAPEVVLARKRNMSADIWSLGCVFLDMVTILKGSSLDKKKAFFEGAGDGYTAPWKNRDGLEAWISMLEEGGIEHKKPLQWIRQMTAEDPQIRPDAATLMSSILSAAADGENYCGNCCSEELTSDDSSWSGSSSEAEDDRDMITRSSLQSGSISAALSPTASLLTASGQHELFNQHSQSTGSYFPSPITITPQPYIPPLDWQKRTQAFFPATSSSQDGGGVHKDEVSSIEPPATRTTSIYTMNTNEDSGYRSGSSSGLKGLQDLINLAGSSQRLSSAARPISQDRLRWSAGLERQILAPIPQGVQSLASQSPWVQNMTDKDGPDESRSSFGSGPHPSDNRLQNMSSSLFEDGIEVVPHDGAPASARTEIAEYYAMPEVAHHSPAQELDQIRSDQRTAHIKTLFRSGSLNLEAAVVKLRHQFTNWATMLLRAIQPSDTSTALYSMLHLSVCFEDQEVAKEVMSHYIEAGAKVNANSFGLNTPLQYAAAKNRADHVAYLLQSGSDAAHKNVRKQTALHIAAREKSQEVTGILLPHMLAADINLQDDCGRTALHLACKSGDLPIAKLLVRTGADMSTKDQSGCTPLMYCSPDMSAEFFHFFREHRAATKVSSSSAIESRRFDDLTLTCLYLPAPKDEVGILLGPFAEGGPWRGDSPCPCERCKIVKAVELLLNGDQEPILSCTCSTHVTAVAIQLLTDIQELEEAFQECGCKGCAESRRKCGDLSEIRPPIRLCGCVFDQERDKFYIPGLCSLGQYRGHEYYDKRIERAIPRPCDCPDCQKIRNAAAVCRLSEAGFTGKKSYRLVPKEAWAWMMSLFTKNAEGHRKFAMVPDVMRDIAAILLGAGANVNASDSSYETFLHIAAATGNLAMASFLISKGARRSLEDKEGNSPLVKAVHYHRPEMVRLLLRQGAQIDKPNGGLRDNVRRPILHDTISRYGVFGYMLPLLLAHEPNINIEDRDYTTPLQYAILHKNEIAARLLIESGARTDMVTKAARKPLFQAIDERAPAVVRELAMSGTFVHATQTEPSALHYAASVGAGECVRVLLDVPEARPDVLQLDAAKNTPLRLIAACDPTDAVLAAAQAMIARGAKLDVEDAVGNTPMHAAARANSLPMVMLLIQAGAVPEAQNPDGKTPCDLAMSKRNREVAEFLGGRLKKRWYQRE